jgi:uncharacterized protein YgiM (DUF1202 family)
MTLEKKIFDACLWLTAACLLMAFLTSCSPYAPIVKQSGTMTPDPSMTASKIAVNSQYLATPTPRPSCTVTAYTLNMRSAGSMSARVIQILTNGEAVTMIGTPAAGWVQVIARSRAGWIAARYCK